ncbi:hypothetical protein HFO26_27800 [Rhizobium leguminosarum]|uniref:hypothetical protein n=1 Tax=Rhizobium leguminosarum TaxID=384 RepID=UPI001C9481E8|nr:hypothetical protein [Rhizobium leguminosarum]MBY5734056.1 hypothetical protein [Rhizobium leguminosarum]
MADILLREIDDTTRQDHTRLLASDGCLYLYEYTSRRGYDFSATNNLISNLKKKPSTAGSPSYKYKIRAIQSCIADLKSVLRPSWLATGTLVPIPCSKAENHPDYDDRIEQICRGVSPQGDVRRLVRQTQSTTASHEAADGERLTVEDLLAVYAIDEAVANPAPTAIAIVDDVLTAGTHYRAMYTILSRRFPGVPIYGIFIARRVFPDPFEEE